MRLLVVCRAIEDMAGGVERSAIALMNEMVARGHEVALLTWDRTGAEAYYAMDPTIHWHRLNMGNPARKAGFTLRLRRMYAIRRVVSQLRPQVTIAFQEGPFIATRLGTLGLNRPMIASERNAPSRFDYLPSGRQREMIFQGFRLADRITVQLESYRDAYPRYLRDRIVVVPNPIQPGEGRADPGGGGASKTLLSVGRLSYQKNYDALIRAFAVLAESFPDWRLRIVGEGQERGPLEDLVRSFSLTDRVELPGARRDVSREYVAAQLFCLPSRWEGFPNALAEACAHGLPAVAYGGCAGANELIKPGQSGLLAEGNGDVDSLADTLRLMMADSDQRQRFGQAAPAIVEAHTPARVFDLWERLLEDTACDR